MLLYLNYFITFNRPLSRGGHFESQENKKLCFCPSRPRTGWEVGRAKSFVSALCDKVLFWPVNMTGKSNVWPVKASIRPDIVRWPAVIFSPATLCREKKDKATIPTGVIYMYSVRGCLHVRDIGATFIPAWVHSGSLLWLCIRLHDTNTKYHAGTSHTGASSPRFLCRSGIFIPARKFIPVSCKRGMAVCFIPIKVSSILRHYKGVFTW